VSNGTPGNSADCAGGDRGPDVGVGRGCFPGGRERAFAARWHPAPDKPQHLLAVLQYLWPSCSGAHDYSSACLETSLAMLNAGRLNEQLGPLVLPSNWQQLTVAQQLFVLTELEPTARGLPADTGLAADWDAAA
jgi:hypothetical protein